MKYDVAIIGGGLAGLSMSIELARAGFSVVLFEKNTYPFHKVCGEYISNESVSYLQHLGADLEALDAKPIHRLRITLTSGSSLQSQLPLGGIGISRYALDEALAERARHEGVTVCDGTTVKNLSDGILETSAGAFEASLVIGAHGKRSTIDKQLNRDFIQKPLPASENFIGVKYHVKADLPQDLIELHLFHEGYCGISAIEGDRYCMCYLSKASNLKKGMTISDMEQLVLSRNPNLADYFNRFERLYDEPKVISQVNFQNKEKGNSEVLFAGDAAGLIAPLSGNGMSMALHSGYLLHQQVSAHLKGQISAREMTSNYERDWQRAFGHRFSFARWMQRAFFSPPLMEALVQSANFFPPLATVMIKQTHGKPFFPGS